MPHDIHQEIESESLMSGSVVFLFSMIVSLGMTQRQRSEAHQTRSQSLIQRGLIDSIDCITKGQTNPMIFHGMPKERALDWGLAGSEGTSSRKRRERESHNKRSRENRKELRRDSVSRSFSCCCTRLVSSSRCRWSSCCWCWPLFRCCAFSLSLLSC